jgi:two-component system, cell cycle response regulator DivK
MSTKQRARRTNSVNQRRILVVDDDLLNMKLFTLMLNKRGYQVAQAADGYNGFVLAHDEQPDLIIMDVRMPKLSGLEVARTLKESIYTKDIPLIIATAFAVDEETLSECKCDGYLPKPFIIKDFINLIESLIERNSHSVLPGRLELQAAV